MKIKIKNNAEEKPEPVLEFELRMMGGDLVLLINGVHAAFLVSPSGKAYDKITEALSTVLEGLPK